MLVKRRINYTFKIMLKEFPVLLLLVIFKIVRCYPSLPEVYITDRGLKPSLPQNPPKLPLLHLAGKKFSLPQCCQNASEWENVDHSLQILTDYLEPDPERSIFASLINLIKFILIKEELSCIEAMKGPIIQVKRPEGQIFKVTKLENKQILNKIETALANKPKYQAPPVDFYDNIDISNMIPIWRPRGNNRRKNQTNTAPNPKEVKPNCTSNARAKTLNPGLTAFSGKLNPVSKEIASKPACQATLTLVKPNCKLQSLPSTNIKPLVVGCGRNCNLCSKVATPLLSGCPKLASATVFSGCPKTNMILPIGCQCPNMLGCPKCANILTGGQAKPALTVLQEPVPLINGFSKLMTTTVLVPYTVSQLVA